VDFPALDNAVLKLWDERNIFQRTMTEREGCPDFVAYDGPPGTNGKPHIGHMMQSALKDLWPRFKTMQGYRVLRKAGWDTHGLPVELTAEKELGFKSKRDIEAYGVEKYIEYCRSTVYRYKDAWTEAIRRIGRFLDTTDYYATLTKDYIQTDWYVLKQAWEKGLLYQDRRIMPYCARCGTSLSQHETAQGYKDVKDWSLYVKFPVYGMYRTYFVAWTTTPWTLLSNVAIAVNPDLVYVTLETEHGERYIIALDRVEALRNILGNTREYIRHYGKDMRGWRYESLWEDWQYEPYGKDAVLRAHYEERMGEIGRSSFVSHYSGSSGYRPPFQVIVDNYVTAKDGSGIVHLALYGQEDLNLIRDNILPRVQNVDLDGKVVSIKDNSDKELNPFVGKSFYERDERGDKKLDVEILKDLNSRSLLLGKEKITHSYPHCYRCDTPLMYFAMSGWFIRTTAFKEQMLQANKDINWYPAHIKDGRFGNWLENNVDWNISRNRYWGSPLPIWRCDKCVQVFVIESLDELEEYLGEPLPDNFDPHKPYIDNLNLKCPGFGKKSDQKLLKTLIEIGTVKYGQTCSGTLKRVPEVLDSWFNAGIMPWGQWGYPAKDGSKEIFEKQFPADFICEAIDQTRGWFYTMLATSVMLKNQTSYKNCICTELISDVEGRKMSKSRGNVVDPIGLCDKYGADAVRWNFYCINPWTARRFDEEELAEGLRQVIIPYWNAYSFFVTYARVDGWKPNDADANSDDEKPKAHSLKPKADNNAKANNNLLDKWILSRLEWLKMSVTNALEGYDAALAAANIGQFIDELTNWYIRRSRRRFWKSEDDRDKKAAYQTLYTVLMTTNRILAPFLPFLSEAIYQNLEKAYYINSFDSVHLASWPVSHPEWRDETLESAMAAVREVITLARSLRAEGGTRVRQPLPEMVVAGVIKSLMEPYQDVILDELNIKRLRFAYSAEELFIWRAKGEWKALGPRFGAKAKAMIETIAALAPNEVKQLAESGQVVINGEVIRRDEVTLTQEAAPGYWVRSENGVTVAIEHRVDDALLKEGLAREFVHHIQNLRREADLEVTQRIRIEYFDATPEALVTRAFAKHKTYICAETLALDIIQTKSYTNQFQEVKVGEHPAYVRIIKEETKSTDGP